MLNLLWKALLPVVQDALNSQTRPSAAYKAFFKNPANAIFVAQILSNVTTGTARRPPHAPWSNGSPTIICPRPGCSFILQGPDGSEVDAETQCKDLDNPIATYLNPTPYIVLCPAFFTGVGGPITPPSDSCPTVNHAINRFRRKPTDYTNAGLSVVHCQMWILLEEIVHYYLFTTPQYTYLKPEVYDINKAWRLSPQKALRNAPNYAYYAASKCARCCSSYGTWKADF